MKASQRVKRFVSRIIDNSAVTAVGKQAFEMRGREFAWALFKTPFYYVGMVTICFLIACYLFFDYFTTPTPKNAKTRHR